MFNVYQKMNRQEVKESKESDVIGHDRFFQERSRSTKRRKRPPRRAHSSNEFSNDTLTAARKRKLFSITRSHSSEQRSSKDSLKNLSLVDLFSKSCRSSNVSRHEYSALRRTDSGGNEKQPPVNQLGSDSFINCRNFLSTNNRYELKRQLENIGSRGDKNWFIVQDIALGAERLLSVISLTELCPIKPSEITRETVLSLFRGLQHPYIHPILDIEFWDSKAALITPLNLTGSLRDLIYSCSWHEEYERKYCGRGEGLPLWQVQRLGRQILEALLFLRERSFPPFYHLHSGNVILQNGVARLAGLENQLIGVPWRPNCASDAFGFGHLLFEMAAGYKLPTQSPSPAHLELELERVPRIAEVLRFIFHDSNQQPTLEELLCCDFFRGVELRELRGVNVTQSRSPADVLELLSIVKQSAIPTFNRRRQQSDEVEPWFA